MPQLIFYALVGVVGWYGYKTLKKEMTKVSEKIRKEEDGQPKAVGELEKDPETGVYRVKDD